MGRLIFRAFQYEMELDYITVRSADCCLSQWQKICESIKHCFQLIYLNLFWLLHCVMLLCVYDLEISYVGGS